MKTCQCLTVLGLFLSIIITFVRSLAVLEPDEGVWFGVNTDNEISQDEYSLLNRVNPATFGTFVQIPLRPQDYHNLGQFLEQISERKGIALVTVEPQNGLQAVTEASLVYFAQFLKLYWFKGTAFMIRFAHEMNGSWYPWSLSPTLYISKFRLASRILKGILPHSLAMLWAPNHGAGYPFLSGIYQCHPDSCPDFELLDTNGDGQLNQLDDMYSPFYPGDDVVDWVGMTLYHWGRKAPWGDNVPAEPRTFSGRLTATYVGEGGDERMLPDFYEIYTGIKGHNKPLAIPETAAFFNTNASCCNDELEVKSSWWKQVFNVRGDNENALDVSTWLPRVKMINWFDFRKPEGEVDFQVVDWTFTDNPLVRDAFLNYLEKPNLQGVKYWKTLEDFHEYRGRILKGTLKRTGFDIS